MRNVAKLAESITAAAEIPNIFHRDFSRLRNGRGGPVVVEIPADVWNEPLPEPRNYEPAQTSRFGPDLAEVQGVAAMLAGARRPVIYAGQGALCPRVG